MNKLMIIGNVTRDPEVRTTPAGKQVCNFNVAVNRRKKVEGHDEIEERNRSSNMPLWQTFGSYRHR